MQELAPKLREIVANTSLFNMLTPQQLDLIVSKTSTMRVRSNTNIVNQGDPADGTFWVVYGQVTIAVCHQQGGVKMVAILGSGKCFGLGEMVLGQAHQACATANADSMLLHVDKEAMLAVAQDNFDFSREIMTCLGRQFYSLMRDIGNQSLSAHQRVADYLLRQGNDHSDNVQIDLTATKCIVASRLGITPETLSRVLRDFSAERVLKVRGRRITVLDWSKVHAIRAAVQE